MNMHIGLDVHKKTTQATVMFDNGEIFCKKRLLNNKENLQEFFSSIPSDNACVTMEATGNWYWINDLIEEGRGFKVKLAHPKKVRIIAESTIKTDKIDSEVLAHLERTNFLPQAYLAPKEIRNIRELLRYRMSLVRIRTMAKNKIHSALAKNGVQTSEFTDLFGKTGREFLSKLELLPIYRKEIDGYLNLIDHLSKPILEIEKEIKEIVKEESQDAKLLMTVPGLGYFSSLLLAAEIGDIKRFRNYRKLCCYSGVVCSTDQSDEKTHHGHIIKDSNKYIRWALIEAVDHAIKKDPHLEYRYNKVMYRVGKLKARVSVARKIIISIFFMLKNRVPYQIRPKKNNLSRFKEQVSPAF